MRFLVKLLFAILLWIVSFVWHFLIRLVKTVVVIGLLLFALYYYSNHSQSPMANQLSSIFEQLSHAIPYHFGEIADVSSGGSSHIETDFHTHHNGAKWSSNQATVFIETQDNVFRDAYYQAIDAWNQTGVFSLTIVDSSQEAQIIAKDYHDGQTQAAGLANIKTNALTNHFVSAEVYLNSYYLRDARFGYQEDRILNTAIHELGRTCYRS
ncbi:Zn-dependent protease [Streptococcus pluranimalium]